MGLLQDVVRHVGVQAVAGHLDLDVQIVAFALAACEPADPVAEEQAELVEQEADVTAAQLEEQADAAYDQGMEEQGDALNEEADAVEEQADAQADEIVENN